MSLYHCDCLEVMPTLAAGSVDMVMCDPPYGTTACKWDSVIPLSEMWAGIEHVIKPNAAIVLMASQPFTSQLGASGISWLRYSWVWKKPKGTGHLNSKRMPMKDVEDILVFYEKPPTYNPQMTTGIPYSNKSGKAQTENYGTDKRVGNDNVGTRYPKQVLEFSVVERGTVHPTQKPVALMEYLIKTYTHPGETVLDFAMGSGTTGVACQDTGREFIGIEKDAEYFAAAEKRLSEARTGHNTEVSR